MCQRRCQRSRKKPQTTRHVQEKGFFHSFVYSLTTCKLGTALDLALLSGLEESTRMKFHISVLMEFAFLEAGETYKINKIFRCWKGGVCK